MKKLFGLLALSLITLNVSADDWHWSFCGDAAPTGWTDNDEAKQANAFTKDNNGQLVWIGKLKTGGEGFKITRDDKGFGGWGDVHPSTPGLNIAESITDVMQFGGGDTKWTISSDGIYKMTIDETANTLTCVSYAPTIKENDGWYELGTAADLYEFSELVSHDAIARNCKVKLTADIDFTAYKYASIGRSRDFAFEGEFDGQGHTVTIDMVGIYIRTGLFAYIKAATIKNLVVEGKATSNDKNCIGGLGGRSDSDGTLIQNVVVKTAVSYTGSNGDATCGGLFANMEANVRLENCAFYGSINTGTAEGNGGLVGWAGSGNNNVYVNCIIAPAEYTENGNSADFARNNPNTTNCFKVAPDDARFATGELCFLLNGCVSGGDNWYQNLPGDAFPLPLTNHGKVYQNGDYYCDHITAKGSSSYSNTEGATYDDHVFGADDLCENCKAAGLEPTKKDDVYQIGNIGQLVWFAASVNGGNTSAAANVTADIEQGEAKLAPIGSGANPYKGVFNGGFHTVTLAMESDLDYQGLFGVLTGGAEIYNLTTAGSVEGKSSVGGIAGGTNGSGDVKFINCGNEATVEATNANAGGILGVNMGSAAKITMTNCYNAGAIKGTKENGGLSGWAGNTPDIINCYNIGSVENGDLFLRCNGDGNFNNTYGKDNIPDEVLASGELCYKLGDVNFRQEIGTDGHPVLSNTKPNVFYVGESGYATLFDTTTGYELNGDVKAYVAVLNDTWLKLSEIESVPASTPVVLKGSYYNKIAAVLPAINVANDLKGASEEIVADGTQYVLSTPEDKEVGFYQATVAVPAGEVYYQSEAGVDAFYFDAPTGINMVNGGRFMVDGPIYNLAGQRIQKIQKGIHIMKGKKIAVR